MQLLLPKIILSDCLKKKMHPVILQLPWLTLYSYGVLAALGFGLATLYFLTSTKEAGLPPRLMLDLVVGIILLALLGSRVFHILINLPHYILYPENIYQVWKGGMVLQGGLIFSLTFSIYYIKAHTLPFNQIADCAAPAISFGFAIGRIGCFLNGCCYGIPFSIGFIFPSTSPAGQAFPHQLLFPTQLLSSFNLFLIGLVLHLFRKKGVAKYRLLNLFLIFYSIHRFFIEFLRTDTRTFICNLTLFQIISIILITSSLIWWKIQNKFS